MWGEPPTCRGDDPCRGISTHSPRVGRTLAVVVDPLAASISTHSPRVGRTVQRFQLTAQYVYFNSLAPCGANRPFSRQGVAVSPFQLTRPVWGEPDADIKAVFALMISTHSPRVGRTEDRPRAVVFTQDFNSLAPCGANHCSIAYSPIRLLFQLTRPVWGEPHNTFLGQHNKTISTHSPRVGRTRNV